MRLTRLVARSVPFKARLKSGPYIGATPCVGPEMNPPLFFVATYSQVPMWAACVRSRDGVLFAQLDKCASVEQLRKIEFKRQDINPQGDLQAPFHVAWRKARVDETPLILMNLGYRLVFANMDIGWVKFQHGAGPCQSSGWPL